VAARALQGNVRMSEPSWLICGAGSQLSLYAACLSDLLLCSWVAVPADLKSKALRCRLANLEVQGDELVNVLLCVVRQAFLGLWGIDLRNRQVQKGGHAQAMI